MKHSRAPWIWVVSVSDGASGVVDDANGHTIATIYGQNNIETIQSDECKANARLIAIAPDLLKWVRDVYNDLYTLEIEAENPIDGSMMDKAKLLINLAGVMA